MNVDGGENATVQTCKRSKRKVARTEMSPCRTEDASSGSGMECSDVLKRHKRSKNAKFVDSDLDKENFHRSRLLAPRARSARVLVELVIDLPTDCSDFEFSEADEEKAEIGVVYRARESRLHDSVNEFYNFEVYVDAEAA